MRLDPFKLAHWANARKITPPQLAERAGLDPALVTAMLSAEGRDVGDEVAAAVAEALDLAPAQLDGSGAHGLTAIWQSADELRATHRPIQRDGIHFYNYYTLAAPPGHVAPVILDILCPKDRLPALNKGHLEPAITVNLGPGPIHGRWGDHLDESTWQVIEANQDQDAWIVGESYIEPSFCPHSYSLASDQPARIVSYTGQANLAPLVEEANTWGAPAFDRFAKVLGSDLAPGALADLVLAARGHDRDSAARAAGVPADQAGPAFDGEPGGLDALRDLCSAVGLDYRLLLPPVRRHDAVGKTYLSLTDSRETVRTFQNYTVASMASAPHLPDLVGLFVRVHGEGGAELAEPNETLYLVSYGEVTLEWTDASGRLQSRTGGPDDSVWVGPYVAHRWSGDGALLKLSSGLHVNSLDLVELTNTYAPDATIRRAHHDVQGWGYE